MWNVPEVFPDSLGKVSPRVTPQGVTKDVKNIFEGSG